MQKSGFVRPDIFVALRIAWAASMVLTNKVLFYQKIRPDEPASYDPAAGLKVLPMAPYFAFRSAPSWRHRLPRPPLSFRYPVAELASSAFEAGGLK
jgi:hypothetical protein